MTLFASFNTIADAERAAGALLDQGARKEELSVVSHSDGSAVLSSGHAEDVAKHGITTTTGADAAMGAAKGLSVGMGVGILGTLAALLIPGVGLVLGAGAVATALAGTAVAGAAAGGIVGFLKDQGMNEEAAAEYHARVAAGGAILSLGVPSGSLSEADAEALLVKYDAVGVFTSSPAVAGSGSRVVPSEPLENLARPEAPLGAEVPVAAVTPTRSDPVSGLAVEGYVEDPVTGLRRTVRFEHGRAYYVG